MTGSQPLYLHIGMPKSGSTFLQTLLADHRAELLAHGVVHPDAGREAMFHAALEMAGKPDQWGLEEAAVAGTFDRLLDLARAHGGTALVSHEIFSAATRKEVDAIGARLGGFEPHVVVTVRDVARTMTAQWQERVKNGVDESFGDFVATVLSHRPRDMASTAHGFWHGHNVPWVLTRWERIVPPERVHVVVTPGRDAGPTVLWERFAEAVGLPEGVLDPSAAPAANESLGAAQVAVLRQVLAAAKSDGLEQPWLALVGKRWFAQTLLSRVRSPRPVAPADVVAEVADVADLWIVELEGRGYQVHGDLEELRPSAPPTGAPHPDDVGAEQMIEGLPDVVAAMLLHERDQRLTTARLQAEVARLEGEVARLEAEATRPRGLGRVLRRSEGPHDG